jgi:hypothetical protein
MMIVNRLLALSPALLLGAALVASAAPPAAPVAPAAPAAPAGTAPSAASPDAQAGAPRRIEIPGPGGKPFPYTVAVPAGWEVLRSKNVPGVFLGPAGLEEPMDDPRAIYVRVSPASVLDPAALMASIKQKSQAEGSDWSAPLLEVREVGGVRGVLVRMDTGTGAKARSTLVLKLPLGTASVDFMASAPRAEFDRRLAAYQSVLFSVLPVK